MGIDVNGAPARLANGAFEADGVPLQAGSNVLTAVASVIGGQAASASVTVTTTAVPESLTLAATPRAGIAPLAVTFTFTWAPPTPIASLSMDFDGDGTMDLTTTDPTTPFRFTYSTPGLYRAHLQLTDSSATTADAYVAIEVDDVVALDAILQGVWNGTHGALAAGNQTAAMTFISRPAREHYAPAFALLLPTMPGIVESFSPLQGIKIGANLAEYGVTRMIAGERRLFLIYFIRGGDGVWRLDSM